jgi:medium-chain acyl-[acyl-carrier-protein] hydrolase
MSGSWLQILAPGRTARARLFCFAHAGGSAAAFRLWPQRLPPELEVGAVQLPGRGSRLREPALESIPAMVEALVPALLPKMDLPFAIFGHSMGSSLAFALTQELAARGGPMPGHLLVSARRPPRMADPEPPLHGLPDNEFVAEMNRRYAAIPAEVLAEADLMAMLLPSLRADMRALETYQPGSTPALPCPVTAFGGADDARAPLAHLEAWRDETRAEFRVRQFAGGHFYLDARRDELLADVARTLALALQPRASQGVDA